MLLFRSDTCKPSTLVTIYGKEYPEMTHSGYDLHILFGSPQTGKGLMTSHPSSVHPVVRFTRHRVRVSRDTTFYLRKLIVDGKGNQRSSRSK